MADVITIDFETDALFDALGATADAVHDRTLPICRATADSTAVEARGRVLRRTGTTLGTIRVRKTKDDYGYLVIAGGAARFLEFGTPRMRAHPFLLASARLEAPAFSDRVAVGVQDGINAVGLGPR